MRIVDLRLVEDQRSVLGLHPRFSVVTGLTSDARGWLAPAIHDLLRGIEGDLVARVDADGTTTDLGAGVATDEGAEPWLRREVDLLVRAADLPAGPAATPSVPALVGGAGQAVVGDPLRRARAAHATAAASSDALSVAVAGARAAHANAMNAHAAARRAIEEARRDLDPYASAALEAGLRTAGKLEVQVGAAPGTCRADTIDTVKARIVRLEQQHRDILSALDTVHGADAEAVADALDVVRVASATGPIAPPEVLRLADEWASISEHLAALEAKVASEEGGVESVSDRLDAARTELARCEAIIEPGPVPDDDIRQLEAAHERVLNAERKASGRIGGTRARRALDEALAEERIILDRLGYPTWSAWIMGAPLLDATAEHARLVDQARRELDEATWAWERLTVKLEADPEFRSLLDRLERVLEAAHAIVGDVDDVEHALRELRVDPGPPPCSESEARDMLAAALAGVGFDFDGQVTLDQLRLCAERWLAKVRTVTALRRQLEIDCEQCASELARAREAFDRIEAIGPPEPGDGFGGARLTEARHAIEAAEERVNRHRNALTRVAHLVAEAEGIGEIERQMQLALEAKQELLEITQGMLQSSRRRRDALEPADDSADTDAADADTADTADDATDDATVDEVDAADDEATDLDEAVIDALDSRIASARLAAGGGSVPIVLDDALAALPREARENVLEWLESVAVDTQILYVTDQPEVLDWAAARSAHGVGIVRGTGFFG